MKRIIKWTVLILIVLSINLVYYVFVGQQSSTKKLTQGKELNLYECVSIYQMHIAVWSVGWILSPEASKECIKLHFPQKDTVLINGNLDSPKIRTVISSLKYIGDSKKIEWNGNQDYSLNSLEHRAAIAINPCIITRTLDYTESGQYYAVEITSIMQYPKWSDTKFNLGFCTIPIQEGLFRYLQDKGWLSCYIAKYISSNEYEIVNEINKAPQI